MAIAVAVWVLGMSGTALTTGFTMWGLGTAALSAVLVLTAVAVAAQRAGHRWGPADLVTVSRAMLACCVAGMVADHVHTQPAVTTMVALSSLALLLDAVDGRVARSTRTSPFGARLDGEVDAFLILVLSVHVATQFGGWVLALGAARYLFWLAGRVQPWLRVRLPFRYWRKVVAAAQGVVLVLVSARILPGGPATALLVLALGLLLESFGRDVLWSWRHRATAGARARPEPSARSHRLVASP